MPTMNFLPMQPVLPDLGESLASGLRAGTNVVDSYNRARLAAVNAALMNQHMNHLATINPLLEHQEQVNSDMAAQKGQTNLEIAKAQAANLQSETHNRDLLTPILAQLYTGHAQMFNALADKGEAYASSIKNFLQGIPGFGPKTAKTAAAAAPKPGDPAALASLLDPSSPADRNAFISYLSAWQHKMVDPTGTMLPKDRDALDAASSVFGNRMLDAEQQKRQAAQVKQQLGQQSVDAMTGFLSKFMGGKGPSATPQTNPNAPYPFDGPPQEQQSPAQTYQKMQATLPMGMGAALPSIPAQDGSTVPSPVSQQAAPASPRMGFLGLGGPAAAPTPPAATPAIAPAAAAPTAQPPAQAYQQMQAGLPMGMGAAMPSLPATPPTISTTAAYEALPIGTTYLDVNGKPHTKRAAAGAGG